MRSRLTRATLLASLVLVVAVAVADASTLSLGITTFRATWNPVTFEASGASVRCALTLEGSFSENTFAKSAGSRIGSVTRATVSGCTGGTSTVLSATLPWAVQYGSFAGTLPNITSGTLRLVGASFGITPTELPGCLARTTAEEPLPAIAERTNIGELTGLRADERAGIRLTGEFLCSLAGQGHVRGTATVTRAGETRGLVLLLGTHGASLEGATGEQRGGADGIADLTIASGQTENSRGIRNVGSWYENRVRSINLVGGDNTRFEIPKEEANACRPSSEPGREDGTALPVGGASCNIRVRPTGTRPLSSTVEITYVYGWAWNAFVTESFGVRAN
ncbi:MAG TPA: hypothetical protein VFG31_08915 [Conexibacter sp.]|nr:hypothetical protein [Conexibacter sp.]